LAADLLAGNEDPRRGAPGLLLRRALGALPPGVHRIRLRADGGYFAVELAIAAHREGVGFAIGAKRIAALWRTLAGVGATDWVEAIDMPGAQLAVADSRPAWWPTHTALLIRRVRLDGERIGADPRARRRRTLHPDQRSLPLDELACADAVYGYSFILTNLDCVHPGARRRRRALVPAPHRDREGCATPNTEPPCATSPRDTSGSTEPGWGAR
jgi:hypothetical protein